MQEEVVRDYVISILKEMNNKFGDDVSLVEGNASLTELGLLDSLGFISLMAALEGEYGIVLDFSEIDPESFTTLNGIVHTTLQSTEKTS